MNTNNLVDITYSKSINKYVIILKRFPDKPVVITNYDFENIIDLLSYNRDSILIYYNLYPSKDNIFYGLELFKEDENSVIDTVSDEGCVLNKESITDLERNEVINKILELRQFLIEKGELNE